MSEKLMGISSPSDDTQQAALRPRTGHWREYLPKQADLSVHCPDILRAVDDRLSNRPGKTLGLRDTRPSLRYCPTMNRPPCYDVHSNPPKLATGTCTGLAAIEPEA